MNIKKIINKIKNSSLTILFCLFAFFLFIFCTTNLKAAKNGLSLWANSVIPSIFPFLVVTELLNNTNLIFYLSIIFNKYMKPLFNLPGCTCYPLIMGIISGYPVGAKIVSSLYSNHYCTKEEAERMLPFVNNSGPLFIIGTVGITMFGNSLIGIILLLTHVLSAILIGLILGIKSRFSVSSSITSDTSFNIKNHSSPTIANMGELLGNAILSATKTILLIGGFVVIFSIIISIVKRLGIIYWISNYTSKLFGINIDFISGTIIGMIELTNGLNLVSLVHIKAISTNVIVSSFLLGFGGISVLLQVLSIIAKEKLSIKYYFFGKLSQGLIASILTFIILKMPFFNLNL